MITQFKIFEKYDIILELHKGDFVLIKVEPNHIFILSGMEEKYFIDFVNNTIGEIIYVNKVHWNIKVKYNDIPSTIKSAFNDDTYIFSPNRVYEFGRTREELLMKLNARKYNL